MSFASLYRETETQHGIILKARRARETIMIIHEIRVFYSQRLMMNVHRSLHARNVESIKVHGATTS